jgi:hypothetical protein
MARKVPKATVEISDRFGSGFQIVTAVRRMHTVRIRLCASGSGKDFFPVRTGDQISEEGFYVF